MAKEENIQYNLESAFNDSLKSEILLTEADLGEVALDSFLDSGIVKDIPLLNTVISLFKITIIMVVPSVRKLFPASKLLSNEEAAYCHKNNYPEKSKSVSYNRCLRARCGVQDHSGR